jgi:hypothetical protein
MDERALELVARGSELLGRRHSDAAKKRWADWYRTLTQEERRLYRRFGGGFPRKRS